MARHTDVNFIPATGAEAMYRLKTVLKAAGWIVPASSDGSTYNASGDQISSGGSGAGGMANSGAWFVVREPGGRREWCCQKITSSSNQSWRVKYSALGRFTGGTPDADTTPSAADERIIVGGGTDASPSWATLFTSDGAYRCHVTAESDAVNGAYWFGLYAAVTPTGAAVTFLFQDPVLAGSGSPLDEDPVVVGCRLATNNVTLAGYKWFGTASQEWVNLLRPSITNVIPGALSQEPDGKDVVLRSFWYATNHWKGTSAYARMKGANRVYPDTVDLTTDAYIYYENYLFPFETGTTPLL